ncbi:hypothetical protein [Micromonospora sp. NPDC000668]|uniref:hypothetical protein n=1 Tax=Micromonospora sp. NPDC000668 TaxID=3364219 RepID=UPI003693681D
MTELDSTSDHWLYQWMDEFQVDGHNVARVFESPNAVLRLHDLASIALVAEPSPVPPTRDAIVAGRTLDLSAPFNCGRFGCTSARFDRTFLSTWHYFDSVVLVGPDERAFVRAISTTKKRDRQKRIVEPLREYILLFQYLRQIGATDRIYFRRKNYRLCDCCLEERAEKEGLKAFGDPAARADLVGLLQADASATAHLAYPGSWTVELEHESLPERLVWGMRSKRKPSKREVIDDFIKVGANNLFEDVHQSGVLRLPLLQEIRASYFGQSEALRAQEESVALELPLPYLKGVRAADVLELMRDERPALAKFHAALRKAVQEKITKAGDASPEEIARRVQKDYVEPAIADIEASLMSARRALVKKSATAVAVGSVLVTTGVITAMPLVIAAGATALASPMLDAKKFVEDRESLASKDMYFLWKVGKFSQGRH